MQLVSNGVTLESFVWLRCPFEFHYLLNVGDN